MGDFITDCLFIFCIVAFLTAALFVDYQMNNLMHDELVNRLEADG
jgi:hypothetical protein